ncbi:MAG: hypothetical protein OQJ81_01750 [Melioribacteraceae bacterium]|nr:hypothetical protein [Melioribacteraceae bacterium]
MKKILIIFTFFAILWGCEEIPNETIEPKSADYLLAEINAPDIIVFTEIDNSISTSIVINQSETIEAVWFDISTINGLESISSSNFMSSNDNITFTGKAKLDANLLSGKYEISYYIQDNVSSSDNNVKKVGTKQFQYLSEAQNFPPSVSNLMMPAEINKNVRFSFNIKVSDPNGLNDIQSVYYEVKDPDGNKISNSQGISKFPLFDDGNTTENSDVTANDGIYSVYLIFPSTSKSGNWVFNFNAVDKSDSISNTIIHTLKVN